MSTHAAPWAPRPTLSTPPRLTLVTPAAFEPGPDASATGEAAREAASEADRGALPAPPSGWYPDPDGGGLLRWWSGEVWTSVVRPPVTAALTPPTATAVVAPDSATGYNWDRETTGRAGRSDPRTTPTAASVGQRAHGNENAAAASTHTVSVWLLAFLPYLQLVVVAAVFTTIGNVGQSLLFAVAGLTLLSFVLAIRDNSTLHARGYRRAPQTAWALLGPLPYLVARTVIIRRQNGAPTSTIWMWVINALLVVGLVAGLALTVGKAYLQYVGVGL